MHGRTRIVRGVCIAVWITLGNAWADAPKVQVYREVERGLEVGLQVGACYDFNPPVEQPGLGMLGGLELGYDINWVFRIKGGFFTQTYNATTESRTGSNLDMDFQARTFWAGASLALLATERFYAYVQAGAGYLMTSPKRVDTVEVAGKNDVAILAGGGMEYFPNLRHFSFALEANAIIMPIRGDVAVALFPVVRYTFGLGEEKYVKPPKDRDNDGVPDKHDRCPDTWGPESNNGCPEPDSDGDGIIDREDRCPEEPGPASNAGCPVDPDTDGDGLPDKLDRCPKIPGPKDKQGCPDRDDDGIPDHIDKCPDEPGTAQNDGCPSRSHVKVTVKQRSLQLREKIHFEFGKARIKKKSHAILDQVAATLKEHPEIRKLQVEGHTDAKGSASYNQRLSQRRAQAVVDYLVDRGGVERNRLVAKGYGEERPIASNKTERGRSQNRRVEMIILDRE